MYQWKKKRRNNEKEAVGSHQLSVVSRQSSVISYQSSAISCQSSVISYQSSAISCQSSVISYQSSVVSHQLSVISYQSSVEKGLCPYFWLHTLSGAGCVSTPDWMTLFHRLLRRGLITMTTRNDSYYEPFAKVIHGGVLYGIFFFLNNKRVRGFEGSSEE